MLEGSIAVDGTSLTVFGVSDDSIYAIPYPPYIIGKYSWRLKDSGDIVNLECDMIGKYVGHFLAAGSTNVSNKKTSSISAQFLEENGFA